jgi:hypothetical protein
VRNLQSRVGRVIVHAPASPPAGLRIRVGEIELPDSLWGIGYVVTPGTVAVEATVNGTRVFHSDVAVTSGASVEVNVEPEAAALATATASGATASSPPAGTQASASSGAPASVTGAAATDANASARPSDPAPNRTDVAPPSAGPGPFVVMGIGAASLITSGIMFGLTQAAVAERDRMCDASGCPESARPFHDQAVTDVTISNVTLVAGGVLVAGGLAWFLIAPRIHRTPAHVSASYLPGGGGYVGVGGTF